VRVRAGGSAAGARPRITLLTDFGTADGYVAAMRGVLATLAPDTPVDDASHAIGHGDIEAAAWCLLQYWDRYPVGGVHLVVVDPGVGGSRRPIAGEVAGRFFVAPDNGVLTHVLAANPSFELVHIDASAVVLEPTSATFHGRDIFAPAAARLATGTRLERLGTAINDPVALNVAPARQERGVLHGEVVHVDRFGNLITNVPGDWLEGASDVIVSGRSVGRPRRHYGDAAAGELVALIDSAGRLEIAVRDASAAARLGTSRGAPVTVRLGGGD